MQLRSSVSPRETTRPAALVASNAALASGAAASITPSALAPALYQNIQQGFVQDYLTPHEIYQRCQSLAQRYPHLVEVVERDYRTHGYDGERPDLRGEAPLYHLRLGPRDANRDHKLGVFQFAAPHAREWVNPMIMVELAEQLAANYDPQSSDPGVQALTGMMQQLDIHLAPMTNPDGTNYSMFDEKMWRKTRVPAPEGQFGVDINRNFPVNWQPGDPGSLTYPGASPSSEVETRSLIEVVDRYPNIRFVCDWHSYAEEIRRPWGVSQADQGIYEQMHSRMGEAMAGVRGRNYDEVVSEVVEGTSDDYFYHERKTFSTIVETGRAFQPTRAEALKVMQEGVAGARELLRYAQDFQAQNGLAQASPPATIPPFTS